MVETEGTTVVGVGTGGTTVAGVGTGGTMVAGVGTGGLVIAGVGMGGATIVEVLSEDVRAEEGTGGGGDPETMLSATTGRAPSTGDGDFDF